jgi:hypothetical protein
MNYKIEVHNINTNKWELFSDAPNIKEAFEVAERAIGFSKAHDTVAILDENEVVVWDSTGFRQAEGTKYVAPDGSC